MSDYRRSCLEPGCGRPVTGKALFCGHAHRQAAYRRRHPPVCGGTGEPCVNGCRRRCAPSSPEEQAISRAHRDAVLVVEL